jgi:hypothetical protein
VEFSCDGVLKLDAKFDLNLVNKGVMMTHLFSEDEFAGLVVKQQLRERALI